VPAIQLEKLVVEAIRTKAWPDTELEDDLSDRAVIDRYVTGRGVDWSDRYPAIAGAAAKLRARWFSMDGEAVVCGPDGSTAPDAKCAQGH
jgi:hypothetical protein